MFSNITISGEAGVGKSTLRKNLFKFLKPLGFTMYSTGDIIREYTKENVIPTAKLVSDEFDRTIEEQTKKNLTEKKHILIDSWLAGYIARDMPHVFKILVICSSEEEKARRVAERDKISIEEARRFVKLRNKENKEKWQRLYGNVNFHNPDYYNLIIDTAKIKDPFLNAKKIWDKIKNKIK